MDKSTEIFRERLRTARELRKLNQGELAHHARLQASAVSHFETGSRKPSFDNLRRLADVLRVTTDYLLGRTDDMEGLATNVDRLHRHYVGMSTEYQEMADDFIEMLARKAKERKPGGKQMTRSSDPFVEVHREATRLLQELGIDALPVDPFDIAQRLEIELRPLPSSAGGASGMLLHIGGQFGICYPTHVDSDGFKNFSVAHEIGHYRLPGHLDSVLNNRGQHLSRAGFQSANRYEQEADQFAAALLMPAKLFNSAIKNAGEGLRAIESLASKCRTSLEATAIRFAQTSRDPLAVIRSEGRTIDYAFMSGPLRDFPGLGWISKGTPLPADSVTLGFNTDQSKVMRAKRAEGTSDFQGWFDGQHRQDVTEEVIGLGSYGKTLTVLTGMESPEEIEDDEADLEESWTPRFRR